MPRPSDVGVGTAVVIFNPQHQVLLGKRKGSHSAGHWAVPGGWIDATDRSTAESAIREVEEETGIKLQGLHESIWTTEWHEDGQFRTVTLWFFAFTSEEASVKEPYKCEAWCWFDPKDLPSPLFHNSGIGIQAALAYR